MSWSDRAYVAPLVPPQNADTATRHGSTRKLLPPWSYGILTSCVSEAGQH